MNLKQLETFVSIAQTHSFSKTAGLLFLTQPTVSMHISSLESELGVKLLSRTTKEVFLTSHGEQLYPLAKELLDVSKYVESMFRSEIQNKDTALRIAASSVPSRYIIPNLIIKHKKVYPNTVFNIIECDSAHVIDAVLSGEADIGFCGVKLDNDNCKYIKLVRDEIVIIAPNEEKYVRYLNNPVELIKKSPIIMRKDGSGTRIEAEKLLIKKGIDLRSLDIIANVESTDTIINLVKNKRGIAFVSKIAVIAEIESGELIFIPISKMGKGRFLYMVYNDQIKIDNKMKRFISLTRSLFD